MASRGLVPLLAVLLLTASPASATHTETIAPPGNSGVEQYLQAVPSAGGSSKPSGGGKAALAPKTKQQLETSKDSDAAGLLKLVDETTAPEVTQSVARERKAASADVVNTDGGGTSETPDSPAGAEASTPFREDGGSAVSAIGAAFGSGGTGPALPAFLLLTAVGAVAVAVRRRAVR